MTIAEEIAELILPVIIEMLKSKESLKTNQKELDISGNASIHCNPEDRHDDWK